MRNIFDQYSSPENRLTHALGCCLEKDRRLLRHFIRWLTGRTNLPWQKIKIVEQQIPGSPIEDILEDDRGIPDLWVFADEWSLIIENKVMAPVSADQLRRHRGMAQRNGFRTIDLAVFSPEPPKTKPAHAIYRTWPEVFCWMRKQAYWSHWAGCMSDYLQAAEDRMKNEMYLGDVLLTEFDGIRFGNDFPFTYRAAKRTLKLAMKELRERTDLRKFGIDATNPGRKAITGVQGDGVWDFIRLKAFAKNSHFTNAPHFTLVIQLRRVLAIVSLPNGVAREMRVNLTELERAGFADMSRRVSRNIERAVRHFEGAHPFMALTQRHFRSQNSQSIDDARLEFDLRTIDGKKSAGIKRQSEWIDAAYAALAGKRSNIHTEWGAVLRYEEPKMHSEKVLDVIAETWMACHPLLETMRG
jgi:hypothetical protein